MGEHTDCGLLTMLWRPLSVRSAPGRDRVSIPLFFDPDFEARVQPVPGSGPGQDDSGRRWDGANLQAFQGTYGEYVTAKVGKVFPELDRRLRASGAGRP